MHFDSSSLQQTHTFEIVVRALVSRRMQCGNYNYVYVTSSEFDFLVSFAMACALNQQLYRNISESVC